MKFTDEDYALIRDYLNDNLTDENRSRFEANMKNKDFKNEVVKQLAVLGALQDSANLELKQKIMSFETEKHDTPKGNDMTNTAKVFNIGSYLKYAAVLVVLIAAVMVFKWMSSDAISTDAIYAQVYQTYPATEIKRGKEDDTSASLKNAMNSYREKDFSTALQEFEALNIENQSVELYKGVSAMELEQFDKANSYLSQLLSSSDREIKEVAEWYTVLIHLKTKRTDDFDRGLETVLSNEAHLFYQKALELKAKVK